MNKRTHSTIGQPPIALLSAFAVRSRPPSRSRPQSHTASRRCQAQPLTAAGSRLSSRPSCPKVVVTATGRPEEVSRIAGTVQVIPQDRIATSTAKSVTELLAENAVGFMSEWTAGQTSINIRGGADRRPGPRLQEPGADADQRPSRRHRQHLQAVDRRRRAHRDRARPVLGGLRQPEHGRRDQHHPEDRPHRARHLRRGGRAARGTLFEGKVAERRHHRQLRLVCRRRRRPREQLPDRRRQRRAEHGLDALRRHRRLRLADRRRTTASTSRCASDGIYDAGFRGSSANIFAFDKRYNHSIDIDLQRQDARRPRQLSASRPTTSTTSTISTIPRRSARSMRSPRAPRSTTTAASSTSSARASSRASSRRRATSCCSASTGSAATLRSDRYRAGGIAGHPALAAGQQPDRQLLRASMPRTRSSFFDDRLTVRGGVRQTYGTHGARLDAQRADPDPRHQSTTRRRPTRRAPPSGSPTG